MSSPHHVDVSGLKVLVVEDHPQTMKLLQTMLSEMGIRQIFTAETGSEALEFLDDLEQLVDVILCDWDLPQLSGDEVLRQVRSANRNIPFLMITGTSDPQSVLYAKKNGVTGYLVKPFSDADLKKKVRLLQRVLDARAAA